MNVLRHWLGDKVLRVLWNCQRWSGQAGSKSDQTALGGDASLWVPVPLTLHGLFCWGSSCPP